MRLHLSWLVTAVALLVASHAVGEDTKAKKEGAPKENKAASKLYGTYDLVSGERAGKKLPPEHFDQVTIQVGKNAITTFDKDKKELYAATYELDTTSKPWKITMTATITPVGGEGAKSQGLIEADGDSVRLIYALPGGEAPTEFKAGEQHQMFVLKRKAKTADR